MIRVAFAILGLAGLWTGMAFGSDLAYVVGCVALLLTLRPEPEPRFREGTRYWMRNGGRR